MLGFNLALSFPVSIQAQEEGPGRPKPTVEVRSYPLGGLQYSFEDIRLLNDRQFEDLIYPLGDPEAGRLLKKSESSKDAGGILSLLGGAGVVAGGVGILSASSADQARPWIVCGVGSFFLWGAGGVLRSEGETSKFSAVQRFNSLARGNSSLPVFYDQNHHEIVPLEVRYGTWEGFGYFADGNGPVSDRRLEQLALPLGDHEVTRLLRKSENSGNISFWFKAAGILGAAAGVGILAADPSRKGGIPWTVPWIGGLVFTDIGVLFGLESASDKFNAVERYNRFARGKEQVLPPQPKNEKELLDFKDPENPAVPDPGPPKNR